MADTAPPVYRSVSSAIGELSLQKSPPSMEAGSRKRKQQFSDSPTRPSSRPRLENVHPRSLQYTHDQAAYAYANATHRYQPQARPGYSLLPNGHNMTWPRTASEGGDSTSSRSTSSTSMSTSRSMGSSVDQASSRSSVTSAAATPEYRTPPFSGAVGDDADLGKQLPVQNMQMHDYNQMESTLEFIDDSFADQFFDFESSADFSCMPTTYCPDFSSNQQQFPAINTRKPADQQVLHVAPTPPTHDDVTIVAPVSSPPSSRQAPPAAGPSKVDSTQAVSVAPTTSTASAASGHNLPSSNLRPGMVCFPDYPKSAATSTAASNDLDDRIASLASLAKTAGFGSVDEAFAQYYTAPLDDSSALYHEQRLSRNRRLPRLLTGLRRSAQTWSEWERRGYREETIRGAEGTLLQELRSFNRRASMADRYSSPSHGSRGPSPPQTKRRLQDELPNLWALATTLTARNGPMQAPHHAATLNAITTLCSGENGLVAF